MYKIHFYKDKDNKELVREYMRELSAQNTKDARIKLHKIQDYINVLAAYGTRAGEPYVKKVDDQCGIWELRPSSDRIMFVAWINNSFVLLHSFPKKTQKTPQREIEKARRELKDLKERGL
ncbi:MAG: type II toxin-antitoxin system RelE/ParE family toxin [Acidaminococcaceae bacterium]|nr:type II toxin-antitoxin system RelE/ParE family toxin [Acidaminococcaceae bacterium]